MSAATSPGTGLAYGLQRVCAAWGFARSSFYAMKSRQQASAERAPAKRRGPKPAVSDQALLVAIEADLEASPWEGEGHRKVWARLRVCRGIRASRKRVLRVMRENNLLSPHRGRRRGGNPHDGEIVTHAPNLMWGTDGVRVFTVDDGWGWIFTAIEHWNAECVGWHVCKRGDRFAALQPISMGLARLYDSTSAGAARGLALRMDHGSQYLSDHFTNQIKFWGIQPSYAFVAEPQTNGVAERFNRTLKEQIVHGRIYRNIEELRNAVRGFVEQYNAQWLVEKNDYLSPAQARRMRQTCVQGTGCDTPLHRGVQFRLHRIALAFLERGSYPGDRLLTPLLEPENLHAQLPRQEFHRLATQKPQGNLTLARHRPPLAKSQRACRRNLAWGKRGRAELALVYHRPINSNFLLKIVGHVLVLLGHFDYANSVSKEIGSDSRQSEDDLIVARFGGRPRSRLRSMAVLRR